MYVASDERTRRRKPKESARVASRRDPRKAGTTALPRPERRNFDARNGAPSGGGTGGPSDVRRGVGAVRPNPLGAGENHGVITPNCIDVDGRCGGVRTTTR